MTYNVFGGSLNLTQLQLRYFQSKAALNVRFDLTGPRLVAVRLQ